MTEFSSETADVLRALRDAGGAPTAGDRARVRSALDARLAAHAAASVPAKAAAAALLKKGAIAGLIAAISVAGIVGVAARRGAHDPARDVRSAHDVSTNPSHAPSDPSVASTIAPSIEPALPALLPPPSNLAGENQAESLVRPASRPRTRVPLASSQPTTIATPLAEPSPPSVAGASTTQPIAPFPPSQATSSSTQAVAIDPSLGRETALLAQARSALHAHDSSGALRVLDTYAQEFPHGALRVEVSALRVRTLCAQGRNDAARAEADRFLADAPRSPYVRQVRESCAFTANPPATTPATISP